MLINPLALPTFAIAAVLFWAGAFLSRKCVSRRSQWLLFSVGVVMAAPCLACDLFYTHLFDRWTWFYEFRAAPCSELTLAGVGLIAGILYQRMEPESLGERLVIPAALIVVLGLPFSKSALAPVDLSRLNTRCDTEVCLQSTTSTCGPSSAATILKQYGYATSERELAKEALTYKGGTEAWYLARALRKRGFEADFVIQKSGARVIPSPSIAGVVLPGDTGHFVAVLSSSADRVVIADPLSGRLELSPAEMNRRYRFTNFFLVVKRQNTALSGSPANGSPDVPEAQNATEQSCRTFAQGFYDWYVTLPDGWRSVPGNTKYPLDEHLVRLFEATEREEMRTQGVIIDFDPFLNTQDPAERYIVREARARDGSCQAQVHGAWTNAVTTETKGPDVIADVAFRNGKWVFVNFHYPGDGPGAQDLVSLLIFETQGDNLPRN